MIIADSLAPCGKRLTTFVVTYPRFILAEINTHRQLSRNSASSRAIPVEKRIEAVINDPVVPVHWGKNQKGMQADTELDGDGTIEAMVAWYAARDDAVKHAKRLLNLGVHKQVVNRLLEPFTYVTTIVSATEWENFFSLRTHKDAQPEFRRLARHMLEEYVSSRPVPLEVGQWHLPFVEEVPVSGDDPYIISMLKIATARCARVSYLNFDGTIDPQKDYDLHDRLLAAGHMSPFEHCARAEEFPGRSGNFVGFTQYRKTIKGECRDFEPDRFLQENRLA